MKPCRALIILAVLALMLPSNVEAGSPAPENVDVFAFVRALDEAAARKVWPGFDTSAWPLAVFDGERTYLFRHPSPPPEFTAVPDHPGVLSMLGRHPAVVGNSTRDLGGVRTATVLVTSDRNVENSLLACVEEVFHVFWLDRHPGFRPDEMARYGYPLEDLDNLRTLLAEDEALARALEADTDSRAAAWAAAALRLRSERRPRLPAEVRSFEAALEMMEGTANFAARFALGESPAKTASRLRQGHLAEAIRWRFYDSGAALCFLLDRFEPDWKNRLDARPALTTPDLLGEVLGPRGLRPAEFSRAEADEFRAAAEKDIADLTNRRRRLEEELEGRAGTRVVIEAADGAEPLHLQRFDPIHLFVLENGRVAHENFLALAAPAGTIEMTNPGFARGSFEGMVGLTVPAGRHPFAEGIRRLTIFGIPAEPRLVRAEGAVSLEAPGLRVSLKGAAVVNEGRTIRLVVGDRPPRD